VVGAALLLALGCSQDTGAPAVPGWSCVAKDVGTERETCDCFYEPAPTHPGTCPTQAVPFCCYTTMVSGAKECWCEQADEELCGQLIELEDGKRTTTCPPP
jgi:hypothetical protein